jgi:serine/threonine protein kinase
MIGRTISHYQVVEKLGAGGMGEVFRAKDTRLERSVAIKVLTSAKVADPERKRRFVQEAKAASALNHPNIITIYDISTDNGQDFIAMEYVAGKTLDELIPRKGLRLNEALKYAIQMADALAKAHGAGIVHRDLKPANVMVTEEGLVKVLDFGLAKLVEPAESDQGPEATITKRAGPPSTEAGTILGTVAYMSPEQAEGKKVDARSDIFSLGSVLYEMLTGQRAFQGDSKMSILAAILNKEPKPASEIKPGIPSDLEKLLQHCLRKDRERRYQYMADVKITLQELKEESNLGALAGQPAVQPARRSWFWAAALVVVVIAVTTWLFRGTARKPQAPLESVPLTSYSGIETSPSFSPDGNQVVFSWNGEKQDNFDIYIKLIGSPTPLRLTTDPAGDFSPAFSPDGRSIGFVRVSQGHATFIVIPAIGGPERVVAEVPPPDVLFDIPWPSFAWLPGGKWVVTNGLALLSTESGEGRSLTSPPTKSYPDWSPAVSPDGHTVAFSRSASWSRSDVYLLDLTEDFKPKGEPRRLTSLNRWSADSAWTPNGREIIFTCGVGEGATSLWRIPVSGSAQPEQLPFAGGQVRCPAISWRGNRLAYAQWLWDPNIWRLPLSGPGVAAGPAARFIASSREEYAPQYSPDGKRVAFESDSSGVHTIWVRDVDGSNAVELFSPTSASCGTARWSPDGQSVAFDSDMEGSYDIYVIRASGGKPIRLTNDSADDVAPSWSKGGKWLYFTSKRTGRHEVWKVPAVGGDAIQVTRNGGGTALESPDGKSLYYTKGDFSGGLWKMVVGGGEERQVLPFVAWRAFSLIHEGIYFIAGPGAVGKSSIQFLSFATGKVKTVALTSGLLVEGLAVSPDGRSILFSQIDQSVSDLMLVEHFH